MRQGTGTSSTAALTRNHANAEGRRSHQRFKEKVLEELGSKDGRPECVHGEKGRRAGRRSPGLPGEQAGSLITGTRQGLHRPAESCGPEAIKEKRLGFKTQKMEEEQSGED